ncbi:MAG: bifunctional glutamate N-acetyltransferase/amino-acid acetyltransferase ArgJ [Lachnospiraceae bacterium]|nr:bifunctional glutamate N-acetyltransferase/amino-acid acetyltransferase ArgJ [Lachnospiraceae bacterium]
MKQIKGGVTAAKGFFAACTAAQIRGTNRDDMAMLYSEAPCAVAGTFTTNVVQAAPVLWDKQIVEEVGQAQALVVNSGIANACTGQEGYAYCEEMAAEVGTLLEIPKQEVFVASTGVIGMQLPMDRIRSGIEAMAVSLSREFSAGNGAANAILTTDTHAKECAVEFEIAGKTVTLGGMCKGSGMIHPNMCTMLAFLTTDLAISGDLLREALKEDVADTYNMISVDGDTSTNDTVLLMANGIAENPCITEKNEDYGTFREALRLVNTELSKMIAGDGEGATALLEVKVIHAKTKEQARIISKSVVTSNLTKAMLFGHDANFGRVLCAMGYSGAEFDPEMVSLSFESDAGQIEIFCEGAVLDFDEQRASRILSEPVVTVIADLKEGTEEATAWGCDLTYDYIKINADYRS